MYIERTNGWGDGIMRLSELGGKEIVEINRAERLGVLGQTDLEINESNGQIESLIIPQMKWFGMKKHGGEIRVGWDKIVKIGTDMIILDMENIENHK
jgi:YlmC/YmxH family sporulation protein